MKTFNWSFDKAFRKLLQVIYGFDKWHVSPLSERPYAVDVIDYCNKLRTRNSFVEIGCGLGDITRNVLFSNRKGYDMEENVLRAARILPARGNPKPLFDKFVFPDSRLENKSQVLAMVNWIHHIQPSTLKQKVEQYFAENVESGGRIIIDTVQDPAYKYNHNITELTSSLPCTVERIGSYARQREVWSIIKS